MNKFKQFYNSFGFIISFMFVCIFISAIAGEKILNKFLILILVSQLLVNSDVTIDLLNKSFIKKPIKEGLDEDNALNSNNVINNGKMKV